MRRTISVTVAGLLAAAGGPALAAETIAYSYDARGRLIEVARSGTVNDGVTSSYQFDKADNRLEATVRGVRRPCVLSLPIDDLTIIPIARCAAS